MKFKSILIFVICFIRINTQNICEKLSDLNLSEDEAVLQIDKNMHLIKTIVNEYI